MVKKYLRYTSLNRGVNLYATIILVLMLIVTTSCTKLDTSIPLSGNKESESTEVSQGNENKYDDPIWEEIDQFVEKIQTSDLAEIDRFYLYGSEKGYEKVPTSSLGYKPFYDNSELKIINEIVSLDNKVIRPGKNRTKTKYIVIHNTGMASPVMTAARLSRSINNSTREASWHFTVDDNEVYQQLGIDEIGWHASTSEGNNYGIGIEICMYQGIDFNMALRRAAKLTASLLIKYSLDLTSIKQHYDFNGKNCPQVIREANRWNEFLNLVAIEFYGQTYLSQVEFSYESLNKEYLSDDGRVIKKLDSSSVEYVIYAKYNNQIKSYKFKVI